MSCLHMNFCDQEYFRRSKLHGQLGSRLNVCTWMGCTLALPEGKSWGRGSGQCLFPCFLVFPAFTVEPDMQQLLNKHLLNQMSVLAALFSQMFPPMPHVCNPLPSSEELCNMQKHCLQETWLPHVRLPKDDQYGLILPGAWLFPRYSKISLAKLLEVLEIAAIILGLCPTPVFPIGSSFLAGNQ